MTFEELVELLRNPGEDGLPDTIYDDLSGAYTGVVEGSQARIAEIEATLAERDSMIASLKAQNYDLLMQVGVSTEAEPLDEPEGNDIDLEPESGGIASLFA